MRGQTTRGRSSRERRARPPVRRNRPTDVDQNHPYLVEGTWTPAELERARRDDLMFVIPHAGTDRRAA
jgi:hypothetical protein